MRMIFDTGSHNATCPVAVVRQKMHKMVLTYTSTTFYEVAHTLHITNICNDDIRHSVTQSSFPVACIVEILREILSLSKI